MDEINDMTEGIELSDEQLDSVSGGWASCDEYHGHGR
jgi:bacteriocin-like protein